MTLCSTCRGSCCRKRWPIPVTAEESERFVGAVEKSSEHGWRYVGALKKKPNGACVFLRSNGCAVYECRPQVCRDYQAGETCGYQADPLKVAGVIRLRVKEGEHGGEPTGRTG